MKRIILTVTNDLNYDQRMIRICTSLQQAGYAVTLVGRRLSSSPAVQTQPFRQVRLRCLLTKGPGFYAEFNLRLFFWLLFRKADMLVAIDLDTILPVLFVSKLKRVQRLYDAHELFCEMQEIVERPLVYRAWKRIERFAVPKFEYGYTVNQPIADEFNRMYGSRFIIIRNVPLLRPLMIPMKREPFIWYQGAVNQGRSFDTLIPAMKQVEARLLIAGDGNYMKQARELVVRHGLGQKVIFLGKVSPGQLFEEAVKASIGVTLFEPTGRSNYFSLANRFFDYFHAGLPQVCVNYPVYTQINEQQPVALMVDDLSPENLADKLNLLLRNAVLYDELQANCLVKREELNWQREEQHMISYYQTIWKQ